MNSHFPMAFSYGFSYVGCPRASPHLREATRGLGTGPLPLRRPVVRADPWKTPEKPWENGRFSWDLEGFIRYLWGSIGIYWDFCWDFFGYL